MDAGVSATCCERVDASVVETDPDLFDCETCPLRTAQADLWPENLEAWHLYARLGDRFVTATGTGPEVLRRATAHCDSDEFADLLDRLSLIHQLVNPPRDDA